RSLRGVHQGAPGPVVRIQADLRQLRDGRMDMARIQAGPVHRRTPAATAGLRDSGDGGEVCVVVLAAGPASARVQPEGCLPGAERRPAGAEACLVAELS